MYILNQQWNETNIINSTKTREPPHVLSCPVQCYQHVSSHAGYYNCSILSLITLKAILHSTSKLMDNLKRLIMVNYFSFLNSFFLGTSFPSIVVKTLRCSQRTMIKLWMFNRTEASEEHKSSKFKSQEFPRYMKKGHIGSVKKSGRKNSRARSFPSTPVPLAQWFWPSLPLFLIWAAPCHFLS